MKKKETNTFKDKKRFYKGRQEFFDAVKETREGGNPEILYNAEWYRLIPKSDVDLSNYASGKAVVFHKGFKSNIIVDFWNTNRNGFRVDGINFHESHNPDRILCFAEKLDKNKQIFKTNSRNRNKKIKRILKDIDDEGNNR